ncbi:hypothetical protein ACFQ5N_08460 [Lutibacter holmesii]|uniref:Uncharacterized protein n=1 Tax=Lutibacter holmesii TaxID=1137985 RepID=A0ABW3WN68_9FLAO
MKQFIEVYDDKKQTQKEYIPVYLLFAFLIGFMIYGMMQKGQYKEIYLSTQFNGIVTDIYEERGDTYLKISNRAQRLRINNSRNYDYENVSLFSFLKDNDSVYKKKCSDTLFIKRDGMIFHFIIENTSYNDKNRDKEHKDYWNSKRQIINEKNDCK